MIIVCMTNLTIRCVWCCNLTIDCKILIRTVQRYISVVVFRTIAESSILVVLALQEKMIDVLYLSGYCAACIKQTGHCIAGIVCR